jgi:hypothetical protein
MSIHLLGDQSDYSDFIAICGFCFIGFLLSVRVLLEFGAIPTFLN